MAQVKGESPNDDGVVGIASVAGKSGVFGFNAVAGGNGVAGISQNGNGVYARSDALNGLYGESTSGDGLVGCAKSSKGSAIFGNNESSQAAPAGDKPGGNGVFGLTKVPNANGVLGANNHPSKGRGVQGNGAEAGVGGFSANGFGVIGQSEKNSGVIGTSKSGQALTGLSENDIGVFARGGTFGGVFEGALAVNKGPKPSDINGSIVINDGNLYVNKGDVIVSGDIQLKGADVAEQFEVAADRDCEPGTVMVLDDVGCVQPCRDAYDSRVVGVVSGAGTYAPGIVLDQRASMGSARRALCVVGKVYCLVDARYAPIRVGDILTTSPTEGYAMRATDPHRAFGAVLGKAMAPCASGTALLPILAMLA